MTCGNFFFCKLIQNFSSAGAFIPDDCAAGTFFKFPDKLRRKAGFCEGFERSGDFQPHHFPVSGHGVLAVAFFTELSVVSQRGRGRRNLLQRGNVCKTQLLQSGNMEGVCSLRNMSQSIYIHISESRGIRHGSNSQRIRNNHKNTSEFFHHPFTSFDKNKIDF